MSGQVVVNTEPCELLANHSDEVIGNCEWIHPLDRCNGCFNNETRAVLSTAVPVEPEEYVIRSEWVTRLPGFRSRVDHTATRWVPREDSDQ